MNAKVEQLVSARSEYVRAVPPSYDETLLLVSAAVTDSGSIGKADIGALMFWKRLRADTRWATALHAVPETEVRTLTARAVTAVRNVDTSLPEAARQGRAVLTSLPGFGRGDAIASALLVAAAPQRMAVYDRRADAGLELLGLHLSSARGRYSRYMAHVEDLVAQLAEAGHLWTPREVDTALYWLGRLAS